MDARERGLVLGMASPRSFALTWDYRCPFAWKAHDHVLAGLAAGADWDVRFSAFSLGQVHVADGEPDIWDRPGDDSGLLALQAGVAVRDGDPAHFLAVHRALFAVKHVHAQRLDDEAAVRAELAGAGADVDAVFEAIATGEPLRTIRKEHEAAVDEHQVFGVPTFIVGDDAVFVRLMDGAGADGAASVAVVERLLDTIGGWPELNELKHTTIPR